MNKLSNLPRGFGSFPVLEVLDLSYNNLNEESLPKNFWIMQTLRALYLRYIRKSYTESDRKVVRVRYLKKLTTLYDLVTMISRFCHQT